MANEDRRTFGEIIRDARAGADIGLRDLAKQLEVSPSYLSDIENDRRVPSEEILRAIASRLKLDATELLARAGRFSQDTERYMKHEPMAGVLFRRISDRNLPETELKKLIATVEQIGSPKRKSR